MPKSKTLGERFLQQEGGGGTKKLVKFILVEPILIKKEDQKGENQKK